MSIVAGTHRATQEREARGYQWFQSGVSGSPNVATPPHFASIFVRQEQPGHPVSIFQSGPVQAVNVGPPVVSSTIGRQEQPSHPGPAVRPSIQGPDVGLAPRMGWTFGRQEQPAHPGSVLFAGLPPSAAPIVLRPGTQIITAQERPDHPVSRVYPGLAGANVVQRAVSGSIQMRPQDPVQPGSVFWSGIMPVSLVPVVGSPSVILLVNV